MQIISIFDSKKNKSLVIYFNYNYENATSNFDVTYFNYNEGKHESFIFDTLQEAKAKFEEIEQKEGLK